MALAKKHIAELYRKRAGLYDFSANLYYLIGIREFAFRRTAVEALNLESGDTVVEIGCGTGLNFRLLRDRVGAEGKIIGVDLTSEMLSAAGRRIERNQWTNIELIQCDAGAYAFPESVDGVISTFAITLVEEYDRIIQRGAAALAPGKRLVVLDFKLPANWPMWLIKFFVILTRPFGVTLDLADRHPWESVERYLDLKEFKSLYFGSIYVAAGEKR
jgi:ubiquinone/menaquinone biosynthesis C-methylase UbiE